MQSQIEKYIDKNTFYEHWINLSTYWLTRILSLNKPKDTYPSPLQPIWVTGLFRSGTSLLTELLSCMGVDVGPREHLLQAKGKRADLNPRGFYENYLFMDFTIVVFEMMNYWGHTPPPEKEVELFDIDTIVYDRYIYDSIVRMRDDRISNLNKLLLYRKYSPLNLDSYLRENFKHPFAVKNPHFSVLSSILLQCWPQSRFLVSVRHPDAAVSSGARIVDGIDYNTYIDYYSRLLNKPDADVCYISYEKLMQQPEKSLYLLSEKLGISSAHIDAALKVINPKLNRYKDAKPIASWLDGLDELYSKLLSKCINTAE